MAQFGLRWAQKQNNKKTTRYSPITTVRQAVSSNNDHNNTPARARFVPGPRKTTSAFQAVLFAYFISRSCVFSSLFLHFFLPPLGLCPATLCYYCTVVEFLPYLFLCCLTFLPAPFASKSSPMARVWHGSDRRSEISPEITKLDSWSGACFHFEAEELKINNYNKTHTYLRKENE